MSEEVQNGQVSREEDIRRQLAEFREKQATACSAEIKAALNKYGYRFQVVQEWLDGVPQPTEVRLVDAR